MKSFFSIFKNTPPVIPKTSSNKSRRDKECQLPLPTCPGNYTKLAEINQDLKEKLEAENRKIIDKESSLSLDKAILTIIDLLASNNIKLSLEHHVLIKVDKNIEEGVFTTRDRTTVCFFSWKLPGGPTEEVKGPPDTVRVLDVQSAFRLYNHLKDLQNVI